MTSTYCCNSCVKTFYDDDFNFNFNYYVFLVVMVKTRGGSTSRSGRKRGCNPVDIPSFSTNVSNLKKKCEHKKEER